MDRETIACLGFFIVATILSVVFGILFEFVFTIVGFFLGIVLLAIGMAIGARTADNEGNLDEELLGGKESRSSEVEPDT